jgi:Flp pilus assembly protein TadG
MKHQLLTHSSYRSARQHGGAAVELALILIVLITMMAGIFEFGRVFWYYEALTKATRDGARMISISPKATIASVAVGSAKTLVVNSVLAANVPAFTARTMSDFGFSGRHLHRWYSSRRSSRADHRLHHNHRSILAFLHSWL